MTDHIEPEIWLHQLASPEIRAYLSRNSTIMLPVGSVEQHGSHIATGCDTFTAVGVAEGAARRTGTLIAPPLWYGWSTHHRDVVGTVTLKAETLIDLVVDIGVSLARHGFRQMVIVNGHRFTNVPPLAIGAASITTDTPMRAVVADLAYMGGEVYTEGREPGGDCGFGHADEHETSHMMHLKPGLVNLNAVPASKSSPRGQWAAVDPWSPGARVPAWPLRPDEVATNPTGGNPKAATSSYGERLHTALVEDLVRLLGEVSSTEREQSRKAD